MDARCIKAHLEGGVQLGTPRARDAVHGPDSAVLGEMRSRFGVPVLREHDQAAALVRVKDLLVDVRHDAVTTAHREASRRVGEVVLDISHDQRRPVVKSDHARDGSEDRSE